MPTFSVPITVSNCYESNSNTYSMTETREMNTSHNTFLSNFHQNANCIYKDYIFPFGNTNNAFATSRMAFSSYRGHLESLDNFYIMDTGLAMLQTSNGTQNREHCSLR